MLVYIGVLSIGNGALLFVDGSLMIVKTMILKAIRVMSIRKFVGIKIVIDLIKKQIKIKLMKRMATKILVWETLVGIFLFSACHSQLNSNEGKDSANLIDSIANEANKAMDSLSVAGKNAKDSFKTIRDSAKGEIKEAADKVKADVKDAIEESKDAANRASDQIKKAADKTKKEAERIGDSIDKRIER